jgi:CHAD domain-containing protein
MSTLLAATLRRRCKTSTSTQDSLGSLTDAHIPDAVQTLLHAALLLLDDSLRLLAATRDSQWSA